MIEGVDESRRDARRWGLAAAAALLMADQAHKHWMLFSYDIQSRQPVHVTPFFDLVMAWNPGVSYSLFAASTEGGRWALLAFTLAATAALAVWMWRSTDRLTGLGLGLIVGGALGNAYDRFAYGAVADFFHFFVDTERWGRISWYVFNIADVAIVAGVALLLYESFRPKAGVAPAPGGDASAS
ncbi:MAG TPA: signal peptidase II [Beijerinckiaceae bacterium]|jgi:signal peptidase II